MTATPIPPETLAAFGGAELRARIFVEKYALRAPDGQLPETTPDQMWDRIAAGIAAVEPDDARRTDWAREFRWLLDGFRFIPGGRIMAAIGSERKVTAMNCYVLDIHDDSLEGIFRVAAESARTHASGGGVGFDISRLRPKDAPVRNAAKTSSGAVSFMELFSTETGMIGQSGRRGATMLTIADWHPDVLDFCTVKRDRTTVRFANISIRLSDAFMHAVESDDLWLLHYENRDAAVLVKREIPARTLWQELIHGARDWAEPGCLFWSTIERRSTSQYGGMAVVSTNPCAEEALEPYGACDLGSLNLLTFCKAPFAAVADPHHNFDWPALARAIRAAIRFLDNVIDWNRGRHPLPSQEEAVPRARRVGLGVTGLGDLLIALGLRYGTEPAIRFVDRLFERIKIEAYLTSAALANEKGPFPAFDAATHLHQPFLQDLPGTLQEIIARDGLRNVTTMTVPPVGTGAALAGVTSGIEPIFAISYLRRSESLSQGEFLVLHPLAARYWAERVRAPIPSAEQFDAEARRHLPEAFVTAHELDWRARVGTQATIQRHVDNAISSTCNLPHDVPLETVGAIYRHAWKAGCKGISVYREGSREGILLTHDQVARQSQEQLTVRLTQAVTRLAGPVLPATAKVSAAPTVAELDQLDKAIDQILSTGTGQLSLLATTPPLRPRPTVLRGITFAQPAPEGSIQVTVNEVNEEPFELIAHGGKAGSDILAWVQALARTASILLRLQRLPSQRGRVQLLIEQWGEIAGSRSIGFGPNKVRSGPDGMAQALVRYLALQTDSGASSPINDSSATPSSATAEATNGNCCPNCRSFSLVTDEGCLKCRDCGFKEC